MKFTLSLLTFLVFSFLGFGATVAYAQDKLPLDITVSPVYFDYIAKPGDDITDKVRVRNNNSLPTTLDIRIQKLSADENGSIVIKDSTESDQYLKWLMVDNSSFETPSREWVDLNFQIKIPDDAAYGYYWMLDLSEKPSSTEGGKVSLTGSVAVPILLNVKKDGAKASASITKFSTSKKIYEYLPAEFVTKIQNTGNIHIKPRGNIFISSPGKKDVAILDVNSQTANILPESIRKFTNEWNDGFISYEIVKKDNEIHLDKNGKPIRKLTINWDKLTHFRFGPYTANLFLVFDEGNRDVAMEASTVFWVIPYKLILILILGIIGSILLIRLILKSYIKKQITKQA
jgi:hypothetical protein